VRVRFWGTRGSIATPGAGTVRYGGNTSCIELRSGSGVVVVLDCGTGARLLGEALVAESAARGEPASGCLLIGHTHWDHIQGIPFFAPLFASGAEWHVYGPRGLGQSLSHTLAGQMHYQYFPVTVEQLGATVIYHDLVEGTFEIGDLVVTAQYLNHPALTLGYRIEGDGVTVAYACDHEPFDPALARGGDVLASPQDTSHAAFLSGVDLLIHDSQYLAEEYDAKRGWGHSTPEYAVEVARAAGVGELVLFHHDPQRDDAGVDAMVAAAATYAKDVGFRGSVTAAAEGATHDVRRQPTVTRPSSPGRSATYQPAESELTAQVIITTTDPQLRATVRAAADAEHLPVLEAAELPDDVDEAGVVVVDHDDDHGVIDRLRRTITGSPPARLAVLALTRSRPGGGDGIVTDWVVWPAGVGHLRTKLRTALLRRACRWQSAPLPPDEEQRLQALRELHVLDTEPEERFDQYTRRACERFDVPVALVSLVDANRQWFKSKQGVATEETPRDESVCAHAILGHEVFQVPNLLDDDRFADSPAATGANRILFYAGAPLRAPDGSRVGTLCVADHRPRVLDPAELEVLREMADQVEAELRNAPPER